MSDRFSITIGPAVQSMRRGRSARVIVWDTGHTPINVRMRLETITRASAGQCVVGTHGVSWATVRPVTFRLAPHAQRTVWVSVDRTGPAGRRQMSVQAQAIPPGHVSGSGAIVYPTVGAGGVVTYPGHAAAAKPCLTLPRPAVPAHEVWPLVVFGVLAAGLVITMWAIYRHIRGRR